MRTLCLGMVVAWLSVWASDLKAAAPVWHGLAGWYQSEVTSDSLIAIRVQPLPEDTSQTWIEVYAPGRFIGSLSASLGGVGGPVRSVEAGGPQSGSSQMSRIRSIFIETDGSDEVKVVLRDSTRTTVVGPERWTYVRRFDQSETDIEDIGEWNPEFGDYVYIKRLPVTLQRVAPVYPLQAPTLGSEGLVLVQALVGIDGNVRMARVVQHVFGLDQAAVDAVMKWRFTPAMANDQPVPCWVGIPVRFRLVP